MAAVTKMNRLAAVTACLLALVSIVSIACSRDAEDANPGPDPLLATPVASAGTHWLVPNQLAANVWYQPEGAPINGHVEGSFSNFENWPNLIQRLETNRGGLGTYAAELGFTGSATLVAFRQAALPVSVEDPGFTQCNDGKEIADWSLYGLSPPGQNLMCSVYTICAPGDRPDPNGSGWYVTRDGDAYTPDELIFDERMPNLVPKPNPNDASQFNLLFDPNLSWSERKAAAFFDPCPAAASFNPGVDRIAGLGHDYVEFMDVARARFPKPPRFSLHWNVVPFWEWSDIACLDQLEATYPNVDAFKNAFYGLALPCHRDTALLTDLVTALCASGSCPDAVFMDTDFIYDTAYALDVLRRNKAALAALGVAFGINIADSCGGQLQCAVNEAPDGQSLILITRDPSYTPNALHQESLLNIIDFLVKQGIVDADTRLRIASWTVRPIEQGAEVRETLAGSMANTANRIFDEYLVPSGLAQ